MLIFGETVGLRDAGWLTDSLRDAVISSRVMWREADREEVQSSPSLAAHVLSDVPLRDRLTSSQGRDLATVAAAVGVDPAALDLLRPWAAGQVLEQALRDRTGADTSLGVDVVLSAVAVAAGVPLRSELGDAEATLSWFSDMDRDLGADYLVWTVERVAEGPAEMDRQVVAWKAGDLAVAEAQDAEMRRDHPGLYERMIVDRNRAWVPRIEAMLDEEGSTFVLVAAVTWSATTASSPYCSARASSRAE